MTKPTTTPNDIATVGAQLIAPDASTEHSQNSGVSGRRECKLGDILHFGNGKTRPKHDGDIPVYGGNGVLGYANQSNYEGETIVIGRVGAYCGAVYYENRPIWVSDNALSAFPKSGYDTKYLYYFLKNMDLNSHAGGSSHPLVTQTLLNSLDVDVCIEPSEQNAIAAVLSSLDDKIDLLHRQNQTLEAMAQTLFRQWFIEEAREDWETKKIKDLVEIQSGFAFKSSTFSDVGKYKLITIKAVQDGYLDITNADEIDFIADKVPSYCILVKNDILLSLTGNVGRCCLVDRTNLLLNQRVAKLKPIEDSNWAFTYILFRQTAMKQNLEDLSKGSAQANLSPIETGLIEIVVPKDDFFIKFSAEVTPLMLKVMSNKIQIQTLTQLRDTLLPKLMSGEIRVEVEYE